MNSNRTELALIARGLNSALAKQLRKQGFTLAKLRLLGNDELAGLQISPPDIAALRKGARPPIPMDDLIKVLFANRWVCCVCRDALLPVVVHHIRPWSESRDHSPTNLAVLCSIHHSEAHAKRSLDMTLSAERLQALKAAWENGVEHLDRMSVHIATQGQGCHWWYFNHLRLFEVAQEVGVEFDRLAGSEQCRSSGFCAEDGAVVKEDSRQVLHDSASARYLYLYMTQMLIAVIDASTIRHITDELDRGKLSNWVVEGDFVFVQGWFTLTGLESNAPGTQPVLGKRSVNNVDITFVFDRNEGTSTSARTLWLRGSQNLGCFILVNRIQRLLGRLELTGTVLAIRNAHPDMKKRMYHAGLYEAGLAGDIYDDSQEEDFEEIQ